MVRPGGSYTGANPPTPEQIASQQNLLDLARKNLELAKRDHQKIRADFAEQFKRFEAAHGRQPTRRELVIADMRRYANDENGVDEQLDISADNWNVYLAADDAAQSEEAAANAAGQEMEVAGQRGEDATGQAGEAAAGDTEREEVEVEGRDDMNLDFPITPP